MEPELQPEEVPAEEAKPEAPPSSIYETNMKVSDQSFIQQNYRNMDLETLAENVELPEEEVALYVKQWDEFLRSKGVNPDKRFVISVSLNEDDGNCSFGIQWPPANKIEDSIDNIANLLFSLNNGDFKRGIVATLLQFGQERGATKMVMAILEKWNERNRGKEKPIVEAHEVFGEMK